MLIPEPWGHSGRRRMPVIWHPSDCSHSLWWAPSPPHREWLQFDDCQITDKEVHSSSLGKESACNAGDWGSIPGSGISPGEGNGNPLYYSCLEKSHGQKSLTGYTHGIARVGHDLVTKSPPRKTRMWKTGYWPQIGEVHIKGMISVNSDSCIIPHIDKC